MNKVIPIDTKEFEYEIIAVKEKTSCTDKRDICIAITDDRNHVLFISSGIAFKFSVIDIIYIVNSLRGNVLSKLNNGEMLLPGIVDQYLANIKDHMALIEPLSESGENVYDQLLRDNEYNEELGACGPSVELCNLIQNMATICRVALAERRS